MDAGINYLQRDSSTLKTTIDLNRDTMNACGFSEEMYSSFVQSIENLKLKETAQQSAAKDSEEKTTAQNEIISNLQKRISDIKAAAKSAYGKDKQILKLFKVGADIPKAVKSLIPLCSYLIELVEERKTELLKSGLTQAKIDLLNTASNDLKAADDAQENAKKIKKSKTLERDAAAKELKEQVFKIRNFAKACFSGKPEILVQFKRIPKGRGGASEEEETPAEDAVNK